MKKLLLAAVLATCGVADANAAPLIWTLHDVRFQYGGTAEGWFSFNSEARTIQDFAVTVSSGANPAFTPATYSSSNAVVRIFGTLYEFRMKDSNRSLRIATANTLSASGGSVNLISTNYTGECFDCSPWRGFSNLGSITTAAVPEPATWAMTILGFGVVGAAARRRRRHVGVASA